MKIFVGSSLCPGAREVRKSSGYFFSITYHFEEKRLEELRLQAFQNKKKQPLFPYSKLSHKPAVLSDGGIDLGVATFLATSEGDEFTCSLLETEFQKLRKLNSQKRRKVKEGKKLDRAVESRRLSTLRRQIAKQHEKIQRTRADFLRKVANYLILNYSQIFHEDLDLLRLIEKGKELGHDYERRLHSAALGKFLTYLYQRAEGSFCSLVAVNPAWTSCICPFCLFPKRKKLSERHHHCANCGAMMSRDVAGAKIVKIAGTNPAALSVAKAQLVLDAKASRAAANSGTAEAPTSIAIRR